MHLNCSLCKFNRYFADNYGDICFLKKEKPNGYEFMEYYNKYSSCDYCCKSGAYSEICDICRHEKNYNIFVAEPDKGRCVQNCTGEYKYFDPDKGIFKTENIGYSTLIVNNSDSG